MKGKPPVRDTTEYWFAWEKSEISFRARPIHWKGWLSFLLIVGAMTGLPHLAIRMLPPDQAPMPGSLLFALAISFAIGFPALIALIKAKGRPARRD